MTHEQYIAAIASLAASRVNEKLHFKLTYGAGTDGIRGTTFYSAWKNGEASPVPFVEISTMTEENPIQIACTTIHELAHVLAGPGTGHSALWKNCCERLGLRAAKGSGMVYTLSALAPEIRAYVESVELLDGKWGKCLNAPRMPRPCIAGIGTRGGKSRGPGSGSRMRKYTCACP